MASCCSLLVLELVLLYEEPGYEGLCVGYVSAVRTLKGTKTGCDAVY